VKSIVWFLLNRRFVLMVVAGCVFIISVYCYLYSHDLAFRIVPLAVSYAALVAVVYVFVCYFRGLAKQTFKDRGETISKNDIDEFSRLARNMKVKLDNKRPYRKVKRLHDIGADLLRLRPRIILGEELYIALDDSERLAVMAHEFAHIKMKHLWVRVGSIAAALTLVLCGLPSYQLNLGQRFLCTGMILTTVFMAFWVSSYFCEYWADDVAAKYTKNKDVYVRALQKIQTENKWDSESVTHPSINSRVARLSKN